MLVIMYSIIKCCFEMFVSTLVFILTVMVTFFVFCQIPQHFWFLLLSNCGLVSPPKPYSNDYQTNWYGEDDDSNTHPNYKQPGWGGAEF